LLEIMFYWRVSTSHSEGWEVARDYVLLESFDHTQRDGKLLDYVLLESFDLTLRGMGSC
jgi:hypothetical protein